jgi:type II secretory pathway component PulC
MNKPNWKLLIGGAVLGTALILFGFSQLAEGHGYHDAITVEHDKVWVTEAARKHIATEGLVKVMNSFHAKPMMSADGLYGFEISNMDDDCVLKTIKIQEKDVLTHIRGVRVTGADIAIKLLKHVKNLRAWDYTILRRGKKHLIHVRVQ